ncbi:hypothetical protein JCM10207_000020 [Rhodosporidiobolus poonsookiae]
MGQWSTNLLHIDLASSIHDLHLYYTVHGDEIRLDSDADDLRILRDGIDRRWTNGGCYEIDIRAVVRPPTAPKGRGATQRAPPSESKGMAARAPASSASATPDAAPLIDLKVALPLSAAHILSLPPSPAPTFAAVLSGSKALLGLPLDTAVEVVLLDDAGPVRIKCEREWRDVGWPRAKRVCREGREEGGWKAVTVELRTEV